MEVVRKGWDAKVSKRPETNAEVVGGDGAEAVDDEAVENSGSFLNFQSGFVKKYGDFLAKKTPRYIFSDHY